MSPLSETVVVRDEEYLTRRVLFIPQKIRVTHYRLGILSFEFAQPKDGSALIGYPTIDGMHHGEIQNEDDVWKFCFAEREIIIISLDYNQVMKKIDDYLQGSGFGQLDAGEQGS